MNYFEDFCVGDEWTFPSWSIKEEDAFAFATEYDPQPIHLDKELASQTHFGRPIVSGWQTLLKSIRYFVDGVMKDTAGLASPGVDEIRWVRPVLPNEIITSGARVTEIKESESRPDRGLVWFEVFANNSAGEQVLSSVGVFFIAKKPQD